jgi:hypothetical protein
MQGITLIFSVKRKPETRYHKTGGLSITEVLRWRLKRVRRIEPRPTGSIAHGTGYRWLAGARSCTAGPIGNRFVTMDCCPIWRSHSRATFAPLLRVLPLPHYLKVVAPVLEFRLALNRRQFEAATFKFSWRTTLTELLFPTATSHRISISGRWMARISRCPTPTFQFPK